MGLNCELQRRHIGSLGDDERAGFCQCGGIRFGVGVA